MKKLITFAICLFLAGYAYAGDTVNPHTGNMQKVLDVAEEDGTPTCYAPETLKVTNGSLTDNGDGTCSLSVLTPAAADLTHLRLDASNDPMTGTVSFDYPYGISWPYTGFGEFRADLWTDRNIGPMFSTNGAMFFYDGDVLGSRSGLTLQFHGWNADPQVTIGNLYGDGAGSEAILPLVTVHDLDVTLGGRVILTGSLDATSATYKWLDVEPTITAHADADTLYGIYLNPTFADGGYAGVVRYSLYNASTELSYFAGNILLSTDKSIYFRDTDMGIYSSGATTLTVKSALGTVNLNPDLQVVIGVGGADKDYSLKFDGETSDGTLTYMEDELRFDFDQNVALKVDSKALYFGAGYDASILYDGGDMVFNSQLVGAGSFEFLGGTVNVANTINAFDTSAWGKAISLDHNGTDGTLTTSDGDISLVPEGDVVIRSDTKFLLFGAGNDASITFDGNSLNIVANAVTATDDLLLTGRYIAISQSLITPSYLIDIRDSSGGGARPQLHFSYGDVDSGGYIMSADENNFYMSAGSVWNGARWNAKATSATILGGDGAVYSFFANTSLTVGNDYTPTLRFSIGTTGAALPDNHALKFGTDGDTGFYFNSGVFYQYNWKSVTSFDINSGQSNTDFNVYGDNNLAFAVDAGTENVRIPQDSKSLTFGAGDDASITFDGNSLNIVANAVTAGDDLELTGDTITLTGSRTTVTGDLYVGNNAAADPAIVFDGDTNDGQITWMEDEDYFNFADKIRSDLGVCFGGTTDYIISDAGGHLDLYGSTNIDFNIGVTEQLTLTDGALTPTTDSDIDLGDVTHYYKDIYCDSVVLSVPSHVRAYLNQAQDNITTDSWVKVNLNGETYDTNSEFNTGTYTYTASTAGTYMVVGQVTFTNTVADKIYWVAIYLNGALVSESINQSSVASSLTINVTDVIDLAATDTLELYCRHSSGASTPDLVQGAYTFMAIKKLN